MGRALQHMIDAARAALEEIVERRLRGHLRQPRIVAHQLIPAALRRGIRTHIGSAELAISHVEQSRLRNENVELVAHLPLQGICAFVYRNVFSHGSILPIGYLGTLWRLYSWTIARATEPLGSKRTRSMSLPVLMSFHRLFSGDSSVGSIRYAGRPGSP